MPIYTYRCAAGHEFEAIVKMDGSDAPLCCPVLVEMPDRLKEPDEYRECSQHVQKVVSLNAKSFPGADSWRKK